MYYEVFNYGGSEYEVIVNDEMSKEKTFKVILKKMRVKFIVCV